MLTLASSVYLTVWVSALRTRWRVQLRFPGSMLTIVYHFHVLPRRHYDFRHAWSAAEGTVKTVIGLRSCHFHVPELRRSPFKLILNWDDKRAFARFTRTWVGVWVINGMGLPPKDFFAPTQTNILSPFDMPFHQQAA